MAIKKINHERYEKLNSIKIEEKEKKYDITNFKKETTKIIADLTAYDQEKSKKEQSSWENFADSLRDSTTEDKRNFRNTLERNFCGRILRILLERIDSHKFSLDDMDDINSLKESLDWFKHTDDKKEEAKKKSQGLRSPLQNTIYPELKNAYENNKTKTDMALDSLEAFRSQVSAKQEQAWRDSNRLRSNYVDRIFEEINRLEQKNEIKDSKYFSQLDFMHYKDSDVKTKESIRNELEKEVDGQKVSDSLFKERLAKKLAKFCKETGEDISADLWVELLPYSGTDLESLRESQKQAIEFFDKLRDKTIEILNTEKLRGGISDEQLTNELNNNKNKDKYTKLLKISLIDLKNLFLSKDKADWRHLVKNLKIRDKDKLPNLESTIRSAIKELSKKNLDEAKEDTLNTFQAIETKVSKTLELDSETTWEDKVNDCKTISELHKIKGQLWPAFNKLQQKKEKEQIVVDLAKALGIRREELEEIEKKTGKKFNSNTLLEHVNNRAKGLKSVEESLGQVFESYRDNSKIFGVELTINKKDFNLEKFLTDTFDLLSSKKEELEDNIFNLEESISEKDHIITNLEQKEKELNAQLERLKEETEKIIQDNYKQSAKALKEFREAEEKIAKLRKELEEKNKELEKIREEKREIEEAFLEQNLKIIKLQKKIIELGEEQKEEKQQLQEDIQLLEAKVNSTNEELEKKKATEESLKKEISTQKQAIQEKEEEKQQHFEKQIQEINEKAQQINETVRQIENLATDSVALQELTRVLEPVLGVSDAESADLIGRLTELKEEAENLGWDGREGLLPLSLIEDNLKNIRDAGQMFNQADLLRVEDSEETNNALSGNSLAAELNGALGGDSNIVITLEQKEKFELYEKVFNILQIEDRYLENGCRLLKNRLKGTTMRRLFGQKALVATLERDVENYKKWRDSLFSNRKENYQANTEAISKNTT